MSQGSARGLELLFPADGYRLGEVLYFTEDGTFNKADYPGIKAVRVGVQGGGGGGGGADSDNNTDTSSGGGGGGGAYSESLILASELATSEDVTVGAGGAGEPGTGGSIASQGGSSSFGSHCSAEGGFGGRTRRSAAVNYGGEPGEGGRASSGTGDLTLGGGPGTFGVINVSSDTALGGSGGNSYLGGGGEGRGTSQANPSAGRSGKPYGGGGGGAVTKTDGGDVAGGNGADGIIIVQVLYDLMAQGMEVHSHVAAVRYELSSSMTGLSSGVWHNVLVDTVVGEDHPDFSLSNGVVTVGKKGHYVVHCGFTGGGSSSTRTLIGIGQNGSVDDNPNKRGQLDINSTSGISMAVSSILYMEAGDDVRFAGWHGAASWNIDTRPSTFLAIARLG